MIIFIVGRWSSRGCILFIVKCDCQLWPCDCCTSDKALFISQYCSIPRKNIVIVHLAIHVLICWCHFSRAVLQKDVCTTAAVRGVVCLWFMQVQLSFIYFDTVVVLFCYVINSPRFYFCVIVNWLLVWFKCLLMYVRLFIVSWMSITRNRHSC